MRNRASLDEILWAENEAPRVVYVHGHGYTDVRFLPVAEVIDTIDAYLVADAHDRAYL